MKGPVDVEFWAPQKQLPEEEQIRTFLFLTDPSGVRMAAVGGRYDGAYVVYEFDVSALAASGAPVETVHEWAVAVMNVLFQQDETATDGFTDPVLLSEAYKTGKLGATARDVPEAFNGFSSLRHAVHVAQGGAGAVAEGAL
ncbi:hypothetical protein SA2016_0313 [Sinomonas atrocyanea]|uniref:Uncharacterized protein n=1 Tax=Sinomonas atrocyanea TaxID=37927 RepID=A0A126ZWT8_9MICC|nr:hypothetical protein [Sinomonas atrocyanea]AMM31014.1 hypothetical protein SA2016_0313 [Sinomonas atrocyanea]GEB63261.1 hypothetical protein SAT01_07090 [Sinomonas atrocyanea]GGG69588.1 hypothetical protein GCM10007172_22160 [Sinomonas atrocyanea]